MRIINPECHCHPLNRAIRSCIEHDPCPHTLNRYPRPAPSHKTHIIELPVGIDGDRPRRVVGPDVDRVEGHVVRFDKKAT
ncbi:hypothetical protein [Methanosphaerula palustris]|uniref:hypothetical protein n=1 Tax=Methanosphaerula palustris TaxID=475088 RepID=UPI000323ECC6|nr:hypothetical protein [Methanosphaerula palustris]